MLTIGVPGVLKGIQAGPDVKRNLGGRPDPMQNM